MSSLLKKSAFLTCLTGAAIWMSGCEQEVVTPPVEETEVEHGEHGHAHDEAGHTHAEPPAPAGDEPMPEEAAPETPAETPEPAPADPAPPAESAEGGSTLNFGDL